MNKVNLREKLAPFDAHRGPEVVGGLNGRHVKLVKVLGEFVRHAHDREDELFLVLKGKPRPWPRLAAGRRVRVVWTTFPATRDDETSPRGSGRRRARVQTRGRMFACCRVS